MIVKILSEGTFSRVVAQMFSDKWLSSYEHNGHKCYNTARTNTTKENPVVTKIYFYLETEQGINNEFRKQVFFKINSFFNIIMGMKECQYHGL